MSTEPQSDAPTLAENLLLLLFHPISGTIASENTLCYIPGGAVLAKSLSANT